MGMLPQVALLSLTLAVASPSLADHRKVVDGFAINVGVVPVARLLAVDAYERAMHGAVASSGATHHVVIGVSDARTGDPIADARVVLEVTDPHGRTQRAELEPGNAGGYPDYSGLFRFGWTGDYRLKVSVARAGATPAMTTFAWTQDY